MASQTFTSIAEAKKFARAKIQEGFQSVNLFPYGTPRTKGFKVTVRYGDKS
jgi:hypothetical protein